LNHPKNVIGRLHDYPVLRAIRAGVTGFKSTRARPIDQLEVNYHDSIKDARLNRFIQHIWDGINL
jgi:hypothetical protein